MRKFAIISNKLRLLNFKNRSFSTGQGVVQIEHRVSPVYLESNTKRIFARACLGEKLVFHTESFEFRK